MGLINVNRNTQAPENFSVTITSLDRSVLCDERLAGKVIGWRFDVKE
jgi:hypothetical protein